MRQQIEKTIEQRIASIRFQDKLATRISLIGLGILLLLHLYCGK